MAPRGVFQSEVGVVTQVPSSATVVTLLAASIARIGAVIANESTSVLKIKYGPGASLTSFSEALPPTASGAPASLRVPSGYKGIITGIWVSADGNAYVTVLE